MSLVSTVGQLLLYSLLLGLFFWGLKSTVSFYVFSRRKEKINKLNARVSVLKMHLKGKIKRKCSRIEEVLRKDSGAMANLAPKINLICALEFSTPADYQSLVSGLHIITEEIIAHIHIKLQKNKEVALPEKSTDDITSDASLSEAEKATDKCKKLIKYDKAHMIIIVDIIHATEELIENITQFNELASYEKDKKKIMSVPQKIEIENYEMLREMTEFAKKSDVETPDFPVLENGSLKDSA